MLDEWLQACFRSRHDKNGDVPGIFALLLSHDYSDQHISGHGASALKGVDQDRVSRILDALSKLQSPHRINVFIAKVRVSPRSVPAAAVQ